MKAFLNIPCLYYPGFASAFETAQGKSSGFENIGKVEI